MSKLFCKMNYFWRLCATGLSFLVFSLGAVLLRITIFPIIVILIQNLDKRKRAIRYVVSLSFSAFIKFMQSLGVLRINFQNLEELKKDRACVLVCNHPTLIDIVILVSVCRNAVCVVKRELWSNIFLKGVVKAAGYIPNDHTDQLLRDCKRSLNSGDVLIIFPEGARTKPLASIKFMRGAAHIALNAKSDVRFVEIVCNPLTLTKGAPWYIIPSKKAFFKINIKEKITPRNYLDETRPRSLAARDLTDLFESKYCRI